MSTSMFEVCLKGGAPWGFRLTGGKEFRTSLRISKVEANGKADAAGLLVNDEIIAINGKNVHNVYHTEALAFVKKAGSELFLVLNRVESGGGRESVSVHDPGRDQQVDNKSHRMIEINAYGPSSTVPLKPVSATSVPQNSVIHTEDPMIAYGNRDNRYSEWSPDIISDVTRVPDQIKLQTDVGPEQRQQAEIMTTEQDVEERRKQVPQAPISPQGFQKIKPIGRGARRLTSSSSSSIDVYDEANTSWDQYASEDTAFWYQQANNALRHLQHNKAQADEDYYKRTSSLPRSLGRRQNKAGDQHRSSTLPRKKPEDKSKQTGAPAWYKEMYREINKSMEGQSNLSRLLTADAKKGAFRRYDGATSPGAISPKEGRRQRPKSIHVDHFQFEDVGFQDDRLTSRDDMSKKREARGTNDERRQQRHSVHSAWYREFQKGGEIPSTGLATESSQETRQPVHFRSRSSDDLLSGPSKGLPYQTPDHRSPDDRLSNPAKFEYNNPPDFLELRRKAEAEGALRDDRERELRMLQQERSKWLKEEEELRAKQEAAKREAEELKQQQILEAKRLEEQRVREQQELERKRAMEMERVREEKEMSFRTIESIATEKTKATALYSFNAQSPMEISFKKGQSLNVIRQIDENWYEGEVDNKFGIFPVNYVELCEREDTTNEQDEIMAERIEIEEGLAKAKYAFNAENDKELSFKKNEKIILLRQLDENWYEGEISDRIGIFPKTYVEILKEPRIISNEHEAYEEAVNGNMLPKNQSNIASAEEKVQNSANIQSAQVYPKADKVEIPLVRVTEENHGKPKGERYRSIYPYQPMNEDEVELLENDLVYVLEKCDDGWFVGVCERTGKFGTFPGNYVVPV